MGKSTLGNYLVNMGDKESKVFETSADPSQSCRFSFSFSFSFSFLSSFFLIFFFDFFWFFICLFLFPPFSNKYFSFLSLLSYSFSLSLSLPLSFFHTPQQRSQNKTSWSDLSWKKNESKFNGYSWSF